MARLLLLALAVLFVAALVGAQTNWVQDYDFEEYYYAWESDDQYFDGSFWSSTNCVSGEYCMRCGGGSTWSSATQIIRVPATDEFEFQAHVNRLETLHANISLYVWINGDGWVWRGSNLNRFSAPVRIVASTLR